MIHASELMLGDWVLTPNGYRQVKQNFGHDGIYTRLVPEYDYPEDWDEKDLQPIPLTPRILEKNGWVNSEDDEDSFHGEDCVFIKQKENGYGVCIDKVRTISGMIYYVHELQHALRLCQIDKNIEL